MAAEQAQGKVEASVFAIITAFTSGLDVFRKLRERRGRRKKTRKSHCSRPHSTTTTALEPSDDELQLGDSLRRGPVEIQDRYQLNHRRAGERFAKGDSIAHASLTEVLLKLNTGLVAIISSFLCHGKSESNLDYRSLAHLADCSRSEAVDALDQLYQRLSQSQVNLDSSRGGRPCCPNCRSQKHADCGSVVDLKPVVAVKQQAAVAAPPPSAPTKAPKQKSSKSQLVMVRPRKNSRLKTSSSISAIPSGRMAGPSPPRSPSPPPQPDAAIASAAVQRPPPRLHKLAKKNALRSMTSLAAEPIPEHALPASSPLPLSLLPPPYPGLPPHASNHFNTWRRARANAENAPSCANPGPPKPPKIPLWQNPKEEKQRSVHRTPSSNLLPYSPYPATQPQHPHPQPTSQRSHPRLHPQRHSSMPPIPLAARQSQPQPQPQPQAPVVSHHSPPAAPFSPPARAHRTPPPAPRRRSTAPVPASIYSFASDSTKLGEIPQSRWANGPWDAERAARLNAAAGWGEGGGRVVSSSAPLAVEGTAAVAAATDVGRRGSGGSADADVVRLDSADGVEKKKRGRGRLGALWRWGSSGSDREKEKEKEKEKERKVKA